MNLKLKIIWHRIKTLRTELKILFGISVFSVLIMDLWLNSVPEWFPFGAELGALYYKICLAFITGLIFYFINVHLVAESNKVKTYKYINNKAAKIRKLCDMFTFPFVKYILCEKARHLNQLMKKSHI